MTKGIKNLVTHNGSFHADDIFACATLSILLYGNIHIARTREMKVIEKADFVFDVGGVYDPEKNRFDHHQQGGAGQRKNGIEYASFGLVWKKYGEQICGSRQVAKEIDRKIASPIDAIDNGIDIVTSKFKNIFPYNADQIFLAYSPTWKEGDANIDKLFFEQVEKAVEILKREIKVGQDDAEGIDIILDSYKKAEDKRVVELEVAFPRYLFQKTLSKLAEPVYVVYPGVHSKNWKVEAIVKNPNTMESRKLFPPKWRGYLDNDPKLKEIVGVPDILFSHRGGFLITTSSKEGAMMIVQKALLVKTNKKNLWHLLTK